MLFGWHTFEFSSDPEMVKGAVGGVLIFASVFYAGSILFTFFKLYSAMGAGLQNSNTRRQLWKVRRRAFLLLCCFLFLSFCRCLLPLLF